MTEENSKRDICTFDYSIRVMNNHAKSAFTRPTRSTFSQSYKRSIKLPPGKGCLGYPRPYNKALRNNFCPLLSQNAPSNPQKPNIPWRIKRIFKIVLFFVFTDVCLVTTVKPETVSVYQVKKTEKDTYKKRTNWRLKDLARIDGIDETNVRTVKKKIAFSND